MRICGAMALRRLLIKYSVSVCGLDSTDSGWDLLAGRRECGDDPLTSVKRGKNLTSNIMHFVTTLFRRTCFHFTVSSASCLF